MWWQNRGYIEQPCVKCSRTRVEHWIIYDESHYICEKCGWDSSANMYWVNADWDAVFEKTQEGE